ncbi:phage tail protein [Marinomonas atlantica]|uniref:phage tail protein n=1 Tax=Marinomonas atlantica TaxID=1806668 RepID=UPI00082CB692|nr:phage tail protein [Marinomonas atlantica]
MKKFGQLTEFLRDSGMIQTNKMDQWVENIQLRGSGKYDGTNVLLYTQQYRAVFSIEHYAYKRYPVEQLFAQLVTWLSENDDRSELDDPDLNIDVDVLDNDTADIEITVQFEEDVYITETEGGNITMKGKAWGLADPAYDIAESAQVVNGD